MIYQLVSIFKGHVIVNIYEKVYMEGAGRNGLPDGDWLCRYEVVLCAEHQHETAVRQSPEKQKKPFQS